MWRFSVKTQTQSTYLYAKPLLCLNSTNSIKVLNSTSLFFVLQLVGSIKRILYAADGEDVGAAAETTEIQTLSPIAEGSEERRNSVIESQKRKLIVNLDVDAAAITTLSPRQRLSDASDVKCSGSSPLLTC